MHTWIMLLFTALLLPAAASAQTLDELITDYQVAIAELDVQAESQQQTVTANYTRSLKRAKQQYQSQGQLQGVLAVDKALEHAQNGSQEVVRGPSNFVNLQKCGGTRAKRGKNLKIQSPKMPLRSRNPPDDPVVTTMRLGSILSSDTASSPYLAL